MAIGYGPRVVTDGLVFATDAADINSYDRYENLITDSEFSYVQLAGNTTATAGQNFVPYGRNTAVNFVNNGGAGYTYIYRDFNTTLASGTKYVLSIFSNSPSIGFGQGGLAAGKFTLIGSGVTSVSGGWYRHWISYSATVSNPNITPQVAIAVGDNITLSGWQMDLGNVMNDYYRTTGSTKSRGTTLNSLVSSSVGTLTNGPTYNNLNGGALVFDGTDDSVAFGALSGSFASFTVIIWFYPTSVVAYQNPIDCNYNYYGLTGNIGPRLEMNSSGTLAWNYSNDTAVNNNFYTHNVVSSGLAANTWHCAAITYNGGTNTSTTYYNGNATGLSRTTVGSPTGFVGAMNTLRFGRGFNSTANRLFAGRVSNCLIYNRALTSTEIQQNFNTIRSRFNI